MARQPPLHARYRAKTADMVSLLSHQAVDLLLAHDRRAALDVPEQVGREQGVNGLLQP